MSEIGGGSAGSVHADFTIDVSKYITGLNQVLAATQKLASSMSKADLDVQKAATAGLNATIRAAQAENQRLLAIQRTAVESQKAETVRLRNAQLSSAITAKESQDQQRLATMRAQTAAADQRAAAAQSQAARVQQQAAAAQLQAQQRLATMQAQTAREAQRGLVVQAQAAREQQRLATERLRTQGQEIRNTQLLERQTVRSYGVMGNAIERYGRYLAAVAVYTTAGLLTKGVAQSAIDFESAFTGVQKTVDDTADGYARLSEELRSLAKELPASVIEIARVAEAAGQLGIAREGITEFTRIMVAMGVSTTMSSEEAATGLARIANIFGTQAKDYERMGSTIVDLGNKFASTESEIVEMSLRMAGVGKTIGLAERDVFALSTALSSLGQYAEAGGSAFSRMMVDMQAAVSAGGSELQKFAIVAGQTPEAFRNLFRRDAIQAIDLFVKGLSEIQRSGGDLIGVLTQLGVEEVRQRTAMANLASGYETFKNSLETANTAWKENTALQVESEKRYATTESQLQLLKNAFYDLSITVGTMTLPTITAWATKIREIVEEGRRGGWIDFLSSLSESLISDGAARSARDFGTAVGNFGSALSQLGTDSRVLDRVGLENMERLRGKIEAATKSQQDYNAAMKESNSLWAIGEADRELIWSADILDNTKDITAALQQQADTRASQIENLAKEEEFEKQMYALVKKSLTEEERALQKINALLKDNKITQQQALKLRDQAAVNAINKQAIEQEKEYQKQLFDIRVRNYDVFTRLRMEYDQQVANNELSLVQANDLLSRELQQAVIQQLREGFASLYSSANDIAGALHEWNVISEGTMEVIHDIQIAMSFISAIGTTITAVQGIMQALEVARTAEIAVQNVQLTEQLALTQAIAAAKGGGGILGGLGGMLGGVLGSMGGILGAAAVGAGVVGAGYLIKELLGKKKDDSYLATVNQSNPNLDRFAIDGAYGLSSSNNAGATTYSSASSNNSTITMNFYSPKAIDAVAARREMETAWQNVNVRNGNRSI